MRESLRATFDEIKDKNIKHIISLTEDHEIQSDSPIYWNAIEEGKLPCERLSYPIVDRGVPNDKNDFLDFVNRVVEYYKKGDSILIHCYGGVGRTGTFASCLLIVLGFGLNDAIGMVELKASYPMTREQRELIEWAAGQVQK